MKAGSKDPAVIAFKTKAKAIRDATRKVDAECERLEHEWQQWQEGDRISEAEVAKCEAECCRTKPIPNGGT